MALSIGATTAAFSVVNTVLLRPFPFARPIGSSMVWERRGAEIHATSSARMSCPSGRRDRVRSSAWRAIVFDRDFDLTGAGEPMQLIGARVTADFFPVMGVTPIAGRVFRSGRGSPRAAARSWSSASGCGAIDSDPIGRCSAVDHR